MCTNTNVYTSHVCVHFVIICTKYKKLVPILYELISLTKLNNTRSSSKWHCWKVRRYWGGRKGKEGGEWQSKQALTEAADDLYLDLEYDDQPWCLLLLGDCYNRGSYVCGDCLLVYNKRLKRKIDQHEFQVKNLETLIETLKNCAPMLVL